jgi:anti-sigma factor RsiW
MRCNAARGRFSAYLDHDLTFEEEARLKEHLERCQVCAAELVAVERVRDLLQALPVIEPGADFLDGVQRRVRAAQSGAATREAIPGEGPAGLWRRWQDRVWLRPALGAALGLLAGVMVGVHSPQLTAMLRGGDQRSEPVAAVAEVRAPGVAMAPMVLRTGASVSSPLADIDLSHLVSLSDSARLGAQPEYILEPYLPDPQRGLVPTGRGYGRMVSGSSDDQNDALITF